MLVGVGATLLILAFMMVLPVIILDKSWWWFFGTLILFAVVWGGVGLTILILRLNKPKPATIKIDMKDAKERAVYRMKYDKDNPDNFRVEGERLFKIGEPSTEKTPVGIFWGVGTELNEHRVTITNLNNPKKENSNLINPTKEEVSEAVRLIADNPPSPDIWEEAIQKQDPFGRPITITKIRRPSTTQQKIEQEKKDVEETNAM